LGEVSGGEIDVGGAWRGMVVKGRLVSVDFEDFEGCGG
jgi:hypothetical protein